VCVRSDALTLLVCSRHGLRETELLELMAPPGKSQLPPAVWTRLYRSLELYLRPLGEEEQGMLGFFHQQMAMAVRKRYLQVRGSASLSLLFSSLLFSLLSLRLPLSLMYDAVTTPRGYRCGCTDGAAPGLMCVPCARVRLSLWTAARRSQSRGGRVCETWGLLRS
jgi:hypothetical protein